LTSELLWVVQEEKRHGTGLKRAVVVASFASPILAGAAWPTNSIILEDGLHERPTPLSTVKG
jgi:hypothetical protein